MSPDDTPVERLKALVVAIVVQGIVDGDAEFIQSDDFERYLMLLGLGEGVAQSARLQLLRGVEPARFFGPVFNRARFDQTDARGVEALPWQSWPQSAPLGR